VIDSGFVGQVLTENYAGYFRRCGKHGDTNIDLVVSFQSCLQRAPDRAMIAGERTDWSIIVEGTIIQAEVTS
jgi:hypothetical protein